jgi:hypothetical protein
VPRFTAANIGRLGFRADVEDVIDGLMANHSGQLRKPTTFIYEQIKHVSVIAASRTFRLPAVLRGQSANFESRILTRLVNLLCNTQDKIATDHGIFLD